MMEHLIINLSLIKSIEGYVEDVLDDQTVSFEMREKFLMMVEYGGLREGFARPI